MPPDQNLPAFTSANGEAAVQPAESPTSSMQNSESVNIDDSITATVSGTFRTAAPEASMGWQHFAPWLVGLYVLGVIAMLARLSLAIMRACQLGANAT